MGRGDPVTEMDAWWMREPPVYPVGECQCGCGGMTFLATKGHREKGWMLGQPRQYLKGHHTRLSGQDWIVDENGCWVWQLALTSDGYGYKNLHRGHGVMAHRWFYEQLVGPIPEGLTIDHLCQVRACVNPAHMEPVTLEENIARRGRTPVFIGGNG